MRIIFCDAYADEAIWSLYHWSTLNFHLPNSHWLDEDLVKRDEFVDLPFCPSIQSNVQTEIIAKI